MRMHFAFGYKNLYAKFFIRGLHESLLHVYKFIIHVCKYFAGNTMEYPSEYKELFFFNDPNMYMYAVVLDRVFSNLIYIFFTFIIVFNLVFIIMLIIFGIELKIIGF